MRSVNKVVLIGNLTRDPEMRSTTNEQHITIFGLATNREWTTQDNRRQQSAEFHDIVCWGRLAERADQYLRKGKFIYVEGYIKTRSWDDSTGLKRFRTEIVAEDIIMLDKRPEANTQDKPQSEYQDYMPEGVSLANADEQSLTENS